MSTSQITEGTAPLSAVTFKKCAKCGIRKPANEFGKDKSMKDGLRSYCRECISGYYRLHRNKKIQQIGGGKATAKDFPELEGKTPNEVMKEINDRIAYLRTFGFEFEGKLTHMRTIILGV